MVKLENRHLPILNNVRGFIKEFPDWRHHRWDCLNYCVGYYGKVDDDHLTVIDYLYHMEEIDA